MMILTHAEQLLKVAALGSTLQIPGMILANRVLSWREDLAKLAPVNRRIMVVIALTIVGVVQALGAISYTCSQEIMGGSRTGLAVVLLAFCLWTYRLGIQLFCYSSIWPRNHRLSHWGLCALFATLAGAYGLVLVALLTRGSR